MNREPGLFPEEFVARFKRDGYSLVWRAWFSAVKQGFFDRLRRLARDEHHVCSTVLVAVPVSVSFFFFFYFAIRFLVGFF